MKGRLMKKPAVLLVAVLLVAGAFLVSNMLVVAQPNPSPTDFVTLQGGVPGDTVFSCTETTGVGECGMGACVSGVGTRAADCASQLTGSGFKLRSTTFPCSPAFCGPHFVFERKG